jgi:carbonic anhydrase/acetyltransferase-like protein (isoleucine patch superfamily)
MSQGAKTSSSAQADPQVDGGAYVDPSAIIQGRVRVAARASIWPLAVLRGDEDTITVGEDTNVQDGVVMHADPGFPATLGSRVTVGHRAVVHGARVEDDCLVGIGAVLLNGVHLGAGSLVGAGAVLPEGMQVPPGSVVLGVPARVVRPVTARLRKRIEDSAARYVERARQRREAS